MRRSIHRSPFLQAATLLTALVVVLAMSACGSNSPTSPGSSTQQPPKQSDVILASTTSTQDSGLFDVLIPAFEKAMPQYKMKVVAVGSGEALQLGQRKDADVLLVHSPSAETSFVAAGYGSDRRAVMYNDFVIVGPTSDPAKVKEAKDATDAFKRIASAKSDFISRGDNSGTYTKEVSIWASATIDPAKQSWYVSSGQGMGETLKIADEKRGYTLADRATWLTNKDQNPGLTLLLEGDKKLFNPYHVILVPGARNEAGGKAFADWIVSAEGQKVIGDFGVSKYGQQIFVPNAGASQ